MTWNLPKQQPSVLVVISHYNAWETHDLVALLDQLTNTPAGHPFSVRVVVNQEMPRRLELPERHSAVEVLYRPNTGYNIGAWEHGWRAGPAFDTYLFLQDECRIVALNWLKPFVKKLQKPDVGLVGELANWDSSWNYLQAYCGDYCQHWKVWPDGSRSDLATYYLSVLDGKGIPRGDSGYHLQSLMLCTTRAVLERVNGFDIGADYEEAVASEIAISKKVQAISLRTVQVGLLPFTYVEHSQWADRGRWRMSRSTRYRKTLRAWLWRVLPPSVKDRFDWWMMASGRAYRPSFSG